MTTNTTREPRQPKQTLDQRRAKQAWEAVEQLVRKYPADSQDADKADDYAREAKKLPVRIVTAGLGQALSFIDAKRKKKPGLTDLHADLTGWAGQRLTAAEHHKTLLEAVIHENTTFLRRATDEILAYLGWLNRFTEAKGLPKKENE